MTRVVLYARTSTADGRQDLGLQLEELRTVAAQRGWSVVAEVTDQASGASEDRPGLNSLVRDAATAKFDVVAVWRLDRLARSLRQLLNTIDALAGHGVGLVSLHDAGVDTTSPAGRLVLQVFGAVAEFERALIRDRVRAGVARAQATGRTRSGRPIGRPRRVVDVDRVRELRASGRSWRSIAKALHVPRRTVRRALSNDLDSSRETESSS